jgi:hypothetical protein
LYLFAEKFSPGAIRGFAVFADLFEGVLGKVGFGRGVFVVSMWRNVRLIRTGNCASQRSENYAGF